MRVVHGSQVVLRLRNTLQGSNSAEIPLHEMAVPEYTRVRYRHKRECENQLF